jgi:hypothetical protein
MDRPPKVFISYRQDSDEHSRRVLAFADRLMEHGVEVLLDQYQPSPPGGWTNWMEKGLDEADFVLMICTEAYLRGVKNEEVLNKGLGVRWEGQLIKIRIYRTGAQGSRFIPVLLEGGSPEHIPEPVWDYTRYQIRTFDLADSEYVRLYRRLTDQPDVSRPKLGRPIVLPASRDRGGADDRGDAAPGRKLLSLRFQLARVAGDAGYTVRLTAEGFEPAEAAFASNPRGGRATSEALAKIEADRCQEEDLCYIGSELWGGLMAGAVQVRYKQVREAMSRDRGLYHLRLSLPRELEDLPWEGLFDGGFLATDERSCIIRETPEDLDPPVPWEGRGRPLGILLLMPGGTNLDLAGERELIMRWAAEQGEEAVRVEVMDGRVTPDRVRDAIRTGAWDVVHFAGHARANARGVVALRLNGEAPSDGWIEAVRFAALFNVGGVRLVVLNCCRGATVDSQDVNLSRALSGLGPFLLRRGVPVVVAMRYEIPDRVALRFADEFYRVLLAGPEPGRVDLAVESGRSVVYLNEPGTVRGFITPVLYLAEGHERPFLLAPPRRAAGAMIEAVAVVPGTPRPRVELPDDLVGALRENRCVPVLGPGLLGAGAIRAGGAADEADSVPGPRELAHTLAELSHYPQMDDFALSERGGAWLDGFVLQWVCQHLSSQRKIRPQMLKTIKESFQRCRPPAAVRRVASWKVPGFICTYFDGLLAQAVLELGRKLQVVNALQDDAPADPTLPLLIHLRGTWRDERSLVLTEDRHNQLWDRLSQLPEWVSNLVQGDYGRSLLFLGVHPRDPLARRLCAKLINEETKLRVGPVYFACTAPTGADESYWDNFGVQWLRDDLETLVGTLATALETGAPR